MSEFIGYSEAAVDAKGRLAMPHKFRRLMHPDDRETFILGYGLEGEMWAFPFLAWGRLVGMIRQVHPPNPFDVEQRNFHRRFLHEAEEFRLDPQGRLFLPAKLREKAGVNGRAIVAGSGDWLEIWEPRAYWQNRERNDKATEKRAGEIVFRAKEPTAAA
jgi:MraZ protein